MEEEEYKDYERKFGWVITKTPEKRTSGLPHGVLFMVDRSRNSKKWWSGYLSDAMHWESESGARVVANRLKYGIIEVKGRTDFHK